MVSMLIFWKVAIQFHVTTEIQLDTTSLSYSPFVNFNPK